MGSAKATAQNAGDYEILARLHKINLDLLPVLHELLRTCSVTRTAQTFNMTQPAVSRALRQLRSAFDDPLLVSPGRNARPTDRAEALRGPLGRILGDLDGLLSPAAPFDPSNEAAHFAINTADYVIQRFAPILCEICAQEAPRVVMEFIVSPIRTPEDLAKIDFLIGPRTLEQALGKRVGKLSLWRDDIVCIASATNKALPARITPAQFQANRYVSFRRDLRMPQDLCALAQPTSAIETEPVCMVPSFLALGAIVENSDCVGLLPRQIANDLARYRRLRVIEIAFPTKQLLISAFWSLANERKRGRDWFRKLLVRAAARLENA
ncbi:hypothetical protein AS156_18860 [Bradyrhizobium macuxiense]|uniref:HTH lysR-type domain-containing protein n=2 Tax=Bradyrhizobium macuxiense TaxID=1755647 RepID=A0A125Q6P2_9BRAD|nr:hypothetical protein AS156_18860 [Bradyrhizobium macuxiense]